MLPNNLMNIEETDNSIDYNKQRELKDIKIDTWRKNRRRHGDRRSRERERDRLGKTNHIVQLW